VSVCHICSAHPCLRVSSYTSGLISMLPSQSAVKDTPRSTNHFSVLENCMVGSTKDMLDSNVPPVTEEVVSKLETPEPTDTRSEREKQILEAL